MAKIHIMRLLCPRGHCIAGLAYDPDKTLPARARNLIEAGLGITDFTAFCAACGSAGLHYETEATGFDTIKEAAPSIVAEAERYARERTAYANRRRAARNN